MDYSEFARQLAGDTLRCYQAAFDLLMKRYPDLLPPMITPGLLSDFFKWLQTRERPHGRGIRRGVKKSTIATYWRKLSKFFSWLEGKGVIEANPLRSKQMEFPTVRYDNKQYLNRKQMEQILLAVSIGIPWKNEFVRSRNLALISVAVNCGLRKGELLALRVADIDWKSGMLTVQGETSKSRSSRRIPLNSVVKQHLAAYLAQREKRICTAPHLWVSEATNNPITEEGLRYLIQVVRAQSKVKFHLHQLRHTFAVNFLHNSSYSTLKLQGLLGHRSIISTAVYTRCLPPEAVRAEIERMAVLENTL
jgi:integrase